MDWNSLKTDDIDKYAKNITDCITTLVAKHTPNKDIKVRKSDPVWLTNTIKRLMRKRKRLYDRYNSTNNNADFENYKIIRNKVAYEIRKAKKDQLEKLTEKREQPATVPPLCKNGIIYTDGKEKANILNQFFTDQSILDDTNATCTLPPLNQIPQHKLESISISPYEVEDILKTLKTGKAAGPDSIDNRLLKELSGPLSIPLTDLFNFSLTSGKVPSL